MTLTLNSYQRIFSATSNFKQVAANYNQKISHPLLQALLNIVLGQISTGVDIAVDWYQSYHSEQEFIQQAEQIFYSLREGVTTGVAVISIPGSPAITLTQNGDTTTLTVNGQSVVIEKNIAEIYTNLSNEIFMSNESWASKVRPMILMTEFRDGLLNGPAHFGGSFAQMKNHHFIRHSQQLMNQATRSNKQLIQINYSYSEDVEFSIQLEDVAGDVIVSNDNDDSQIILENMSIRNLMGNFANKLRQDFLFHAYENGGCDLLFSRFHPERLKIHEPRPSRKSIAGFDRGRVKKEWTEKYSASVVTAETTDPSVSLLKQPTEIVAKPKKTVRISPTSEFAVCPTNNPLNEEYTDLDYAVSVEMNPKLKVQTNTNRKNKPITVGNQIR